MTGRVKGNGQKLTRQRGTSRAGFLVALVFLLVLAAIFTGWLANRDTKKEPAPAPTSVLPKAAQDAISSAKCDYPDADLCKFFAGHAATTSYTVTTVHQTADAKSTAVLKKQTADKYYLKVDGAGATEVINISTTRYVKNPDGSWQKQTVDKAAAAAPASADPRLAEPTAAGVSYKKVASETCGSTPCYKYQVTDPSSPGATTYIWFSREDYHLQRWQQTSPGTSTNSLYSLAGVSIATPSPVKSEAPAQPQTLSQTGESTLPRTGDD